ncbi:hypothetical protein FRB94_000413 [Tulasnella sp. JGI-2019a]|nr:hypothetical protein FRB94_000413 [Tulasnella sp. JGI-2019a]
MSKMPAPPTYHTATSDQVDGERAEPSLQFPSPPHHPSNDHHAHPSQTQQQMQYHLTQRQSTYHPDEIQQQQPGVIRAMTINNEGENRDTQHEPFDGNGEREWTYGLCGCCGDAGACCLSCWSVFSPVTL